LNSTPSDDGGLKIGKISIIIATPTHKFKLGDPHGIANFNILSDLSKCSVPLMKYKRHLMAKH